ncbi:hypothetical protein SAMN05216503_3454 [Polaribacter sp. KT25b]|uniref:hypothetical protein n=1 Tax=Polaribacter sp. KT25b TaxID=1855336 RepID=UPI00087D6438|nr:hypothetical protein [Polaribacter sp. KT25b]SDS56152.1 hypothetical protein SAMN05216503_3454 [Polaribacter sp. KT25b]
MNNFSLCIAFFLLIISSTFAQEKRDFIKVQENPIVFSDFILGYSNSGKSAVTAGFNINYQKNNNLFTFRTLQTISVDKIDWFLFVPISTVSNTTTEFAVLYGKRYIEDGISYHFSGGISYNINEDVNGNLKTRDNFAGFPLEIGMSFFKSKKERFRVFYGLIPVGKPTSFGRSIGFKLYANIAEKSYVGLGLTFGLGWHKIYKNEK